MLATLSQPEPTRNYRLRYWIGIPTLAIIALIGLRPLLADPHLDTWENYGSVFQALFNFGVIFVLLIRYRVYMPKES